MDIKKLHQAIKELRAELDRVNLAIERIETIAENVGSQQQAGCGSREEESESAEPEGGEDEG